MSRALTAEQARKLAGAEEAVARAKDDLTAGTARLVAELKEVAKPWQDKVTAAERDRDRLRARYRPRLTVGQAVRAGGVRVLLDQVRGNRTFRVAQYLDAGHPLTKQMEPHYNPGRPADRWTVTREHA